jgi:hypothetical protein
MTRYAMVLVGWIVAATLAASAAQGADIAVAQQGTTVTIRITGDIADGDFDKFAAIATLNPKAQVILSSNGGAIEEGLQIGDMIHRKGYTTKVADGATCASACGYIWLGGSTRTVEGKGQVGFHAAYLSQTNTAVSSTGNALVGAYLARLGFSDMAIIYATRAAPEDIRWLTPTDAVFLGIAVIWDNGDATPSPVLAPTLTRTQVEEALLRQKVMTRIKADYPLVFQQLVSDVFDAQRSGKTWTSALLVAYDRMRLPDPVQKKFETALLTIRPTDFVDVVLVRYITYAQQTNPTKCATLFDNGGLYFDQLVHQSPDNLKAGFVEFIDLAIEASIEDKVSPLPKPTAKDKRYATRQMTRIGEKYLLTLPQAERKKLLKDSRKKDFKIDCRFAVFILQQMKSDPRLLKVMFYPEAK